jgi:hypothetical protein
MPAAKSHRSGRRRLAGLLLRPRGEEEGAKRWLLGSVAEQVVRKAFCSVVVARPQEYEKEPEIEPPCPDCIATQRATAREKLWCERHSERHSHGALHYQAPPSFGVGSTFLRPQG